jgi:serine/threonine protein kinase
VLAGTPHFMAPELFQGAQPTPASDVYALGVSLYLMLCGQFPFTRPKLSDLIAAVTTDPLPSLRAANSAVPLDVAECVCAMLSRSPENRPHDGIAAMQLLHAVLGHARNLETLLHEALDHEPSVDWRHQGDGYLARVELADGRRQQVWLETEERDAGERLVSIYSVCGPAQPAYYADALRLNSQMIHGALALRDIDGVPHFVVLNNYPRATVDSEEIRESILDAAFHGDAVERQLTGQDRF